MRWLSQSVNHHHHHHHHHDVPFFILNYQHPKNALFLSLKVTAKAPEKSCLKHHPFILGQARPIFRAFAVSFFFLGGGGGVYTPENQHDDGTSIFLIGDPSSNGRFFHGHASFGGCSS